MATTQNLAAYLAAWDAAMAVFDTANGGVGTDDILGVSLFDMNSTVHAPAGLWTLTGGAVPDITTNSDIVVPWTDGTDTIFLSYDELGDAVRVSAVLAGYMGSNYKMFRLLTHIDTAVTAAGGTMTVGTGPWTWLVYETFLANLEGRYDPTNRYGLELPGMMG